MAKSNQTDERPEDLGQTGAEIVAEGHALSRIEDTTLLQVAIAEKRDEAEVLAGALAELDLYPSAARDARYVKPVGKDDKGEMKYAAALSIRAAESLSNRWGNNVWACTVVSETEDAVILEAVYLDCQTRAKRQLQARVSRFYRASKSGQITKHPEDRFNDVVLKAAQSRLLREVILRSLPAGLKAEYEARAIAVVTDRATLQQIIKGFAAFGITGDQIKVLANGKSSADLTAEELGELQGIVNALAEGETTVEQLFGERPSANKTNETAPSMGDVLAGEKGAQGDPQAAQGEVSGEAPKPVDGDPGGPDGDDHAEDRLYEVFADQWRQAMEKDHSDQLEAWSEKRRESEIRKAIAKFKTAMPGETSTDLIEWIIAGNVNVLTGTAITREGSK